MAVCQRNFLEWLRRSAIPSQTGIHQIKKLNGLVLDERLRQSVIVAGKELPDMLNLTKAALAAFQTLLQHST